MIDRLARDQLLAARVAYMRGDIRTHEFERRIEALPRRAEPAFKLLFWNLWGIYDDFIDHPISVPADTWDWLRRLIACLHTDLPLCVHDLSVHGKAERAAALFAPFWTEAQWRQYEPLLADDGLPPYDPTIHGRAYRPRYVNLTAGWLGTVVWAPLFAPVAGIFWVVRRLLRLPTRP